MSDVKVPPGNLTIHQGANKYENAYADDCRANGIVIRRRYFRGVAMKRTGGGASHTGVRRHKLPPQKDQPAYKPEDHARTVLAGGRKRHIEAGE